MTKQAQVGAFAIAALLLLFGVFYVITDFGTRHTGYRVGIHFQSAQGITAGAQVFFSGVAVGGVDSVELLPDNTVDVILAINRDINVPQASRFLIQAPLTGTPALIIVPPRAAPPFALLPRQVLPVDQQPQGTNAVTLTDLLQEGQGEMRRLNSIMAMLQTRTPRLLDTLQSALDNANELAATSRGSMQRLSTELLALGASLQTNLSTASANVDQLTGTLNDAASTDSRKLGTLLDQFSTTAVSLNKSITALQTIATDPRLKNNVLDTTQSIAETMRNLAALTRDLRTVTGDPQTQAQLRNTIANLDAVMQKANSLLGQLGGTSGVGGPSGAGGADASTSASPPPGGVPEIRRRLHANLSNLAENLVNIQLRLSELSPSRPGALNSVLPQSQGPIGDLNVVFLPHGSTSLIAGANSIGTKPTWNALLQENKGDFHFAGGVLYSQLGLTGSYAPLHGFGLETRVYNLTYPMMDLYGNIHIAPGAELFFGQRDLNHAARRNTIGLQYQF
jgi:phospholipid/cholesterol/gamma-HCH transport system substrate-binding protein